jgi:putative ABC transport system permease protein
MIKNYFLIAIRSLRKHLSYSAINIFGLSLGLATCILLVTWIRHELSYDKFHEKADRIYRASLEYSFGGHTSKTSVSPTALLPAAQKNFAEVESGVRLYNPSASNGFVIRQDDKLFQERKFYYADSTFFKVFSFSLVKGNPDKALTEPNSVVLTRSMAKKYFDSEDVIGKTIEVGNKGDYIITGLVEDAPSNTLLQFDFIGSFSSLAASKETSWWSANYETYMLLTAGADVSALTHKTNELVKQEVASELTNPGDYVKYNFYPVGDVYLKSGMASDIQYVYIFGSIALLVLIIACINYINLATARAADRAKEVGIRKVVGALRNQLFMQFISESAILTFIALIFSFLLAKIALPLFNQVTGKQFDSGAFINSEFILISIIASVVIALLAGAYPAFAITAFNPARVLKGNFKTSGKGIWLRQSLVVVQFSISIILIVGTIVVLQQLSFIQNKKLGYSKENVVIMSLDAKTAAVYNEFRTEILRSGIASHVARAIESPTKIDGGYSVMLPGDANEIGMIVTANAVDPDFIPALNIKLVAGRNFTENDYIKMRTDTITSFVLNESAIRDLGLAVETAVGTTIDMNGRHGEIVGVSEDFHFAPLKQKIEPLVLFTEEYQFSTIFIKLKEGNTTELLAKLKSICNTVTPHRPFDYTFLDEEYAAMYKNEERMSQISTTFATLTILIACLGLFGLVSFSAAQKTKEIGIRKVLGATASSIVLLITKDFTRLVIISIIIALPLAYWIMYQWLNDFAYKTEIGVWPLLLAAGLSIVIAFGTASFQAIKAALINPVDTLRSE